ncbi:MAG: hypothetical protein WB765_15055 [Acidimicrobiales bacterium]
MRGNRLLKRQIREVLTGLGSCENDVAAALGGTGVRAEPRDPRDCAIAVYLRAVVGVDHRISSVAVQRSDVKVLTEPARFGLPNIVTVRLPEPVRRFIEAFDKAAYPKLIRANHEGREASAQAPFTNL